jgi:hypothetical protein
MKTREELDPGDGERPFVDQASTSSLDHRDPQIPSIHINPLSDPDSTVRGRGVATADNIEMSSFGAGSSSIDGEERLLSDSGLRPRRSSPSPSRGNSILQRLGTLRTPGRTGPSKTSTRRDRGGQYDALGGDEADDEQFGIDLSTLAGMGYQLNEAPKDQHQNMGTDTSPESTPRKDLLQPEHSPILATSISKLGKGMVVGARLKLDPSLAAVRRTLSSARSPTSPVDIARSKSIRDIGQHLAQKRQVIVEVNEPFDLGSLEGAEIDRQVRKRATNKSFDEMETSFKPSESAIKSYFYPADPDHPNWKPVSMRSYYILMLVGVSLGLGIFQEWLCRHSEALAANGRGILEYDQVSSVPLFYFFAWKYLPTFIFVLYGVLWSIMDFDIKRLEAYYQLSQPTGSTAAASLNMDHLRALSYFVPFTAMKLRQWAVFFSSLGNILATSIAPSLQNPSLVLVQNPKGDPNSKDNNPQPEFFVRISPGWSRALTSSLVVTAAIGMFLFIQLRRKSGLLSDPKGIAGIAAMATKSHILADFQGMDIATRGEIHHKLQHRRFVLYKSSIWPGEWNRATELSPESVRKSESTHPLMLRLKAGIPFISFMSLCLVSIPIINFTTARVIPNAQPWLPVLAATLIKMLWTAFESDVRLMEPFYILSNGCAPPQMSLTLDYQGTVYAWMPIKALLNGHFLVALVGLCSVLLDVLTVTVSSFSVNSAVFLHASKNKDVSNQDETYASFWGSVMLSIAILSFSIIAAALVYTRRRHPFLPREPSTIAAVLAFIFASNMLDDFIDTERYTNKQMEAMLKSKVDANGNPKKYGLGWFKGRDGQVHCAIDEEPMRSRYVHGKPYSLAQAPWIGSSDPGYV